MDWRRMARTSGLSLFLNGTSGEAGSYTKATMRHFAGRRAEMEAGQEATGPYPMTSPAERERRYTALRSAMAREGMDALIIAARGDGFLRGRLHYVSDVHLWAGRILVLLPLSAPPVL